MFGSLPKAMPKVMALMVELNGTEVEIRRRFEALPEDDIMLLIDPFTILEVTKVLDDIS
jgi:hypothetical protein